MYEAEHIFVRVHVLNIVKKHIFKRFRNKIVIWENTEIYGQDGGNRSPATSIFFFSQDQYPNKPEKRNVRSAFNEDLRDIVSWTLLVNNNMIETKLYPKRSTTVWFRVFFFLWRNILKPSCMFVPFFEFSKEYKDKIHKLNRSICLRSTRNKPTDMKNRMRIILVQNRKKMFVRDPFNRIANQEFKNCSRFWPRERRHAVPEKKKY